MVAIHGARAFQISVVNGIDKIGISWVGRPCRAIDDDLLRLHQVVKRTPEPDAVS